MTEIVAPAALAADAGSAIVRARRCRFALTLVYVSPLLGVFSPRLLCAAEADEPVVEVVVTGSRLAGGSASTTASPVVVVDSEELRHQGTAQAEELLNSLPQVN